MLGAAGVGLGVCGAKVYLKPKNILVYRLWGLSPNRLRGGPGRRDKVPRGFHEGSTRVPPGLTRLPQGSVRVAGWREHQKRAPRAVGDHHQSLFDVKGGSPMFYTTRGWLCFPSLACEQSTPSCLQPVKKGQNQTIKQVQQIPTMKFLKHGYVFVKGTPSKQQTTSTLKTVPLQPPKKLAWLS